MTDTETDLGTTHAVIRELGGDGPVAELTGANAKAISMWRSLKRFPWHTHHSITCALAERGKTAPISLWGIKSKKQQADSEKSDRPRRRRKAS